MGRLVEYFAGTGHGAQKSHQYFDQCGFGYRAFEIGKYLSSIHAHENKQALAEAFQAGVIAGTQIKEIVNT